MRSTLRPSLAVIALLSACTSGPDPGIGDRPPTARAPSATMPPGTSASPTASSPRQCRDRHLSLKPRWGAAAGSYGGTWYFTNSSRRPCLLWTGLRALLVDERGDVLLRSTRSSSGSRRIVLDSGERASAVVLWSNWCKRYQGRFRVRIVLPQDNGALLTDVPGSAGCTTKGHGSRLSLSDVRRAD